MLVESTLKVSESFNESSVGKSRFVFLFPEEGELEKAKTLRSRLAF